MSNNCSPGCECKTGGDPPSTAWVEAIGSAASEPVPYDSVGQIIAFEQGDLDEEATTALFSHLVKTGLAWSLQGSYGRSARSLIDNGVLSENGDIL